MTKPSAKPSPEAPSKPKGRFRKVEVRTWGDEKFRALTPIPACGQGLWLYLITGPHTGPIPGLFRAGRAGMAEELGWDLEDFDKAFQEVSAQGMVKADFKARVMWIPKAIQHNGPESPNVVRGWASEFDLIPECDLKREAFDALRIAVAAVGPAFVAAFDDAIRKPSPKASDKPLPKAIGNQEQEAGAAEGAGTGEGKGAAAAPPAVAAAPAPAPQDPPPAPPAPPAAPKPKRAPKAEDPALVSAAAMVAEGVKPEHAAQLLAVRKEKRLPLTGEAWADMKSQGAEVGLSTADMVAFACRKSWAAFRAAWWRRDQEGDTHVGAPAGPRGPGTRGQTTAAEDRAASHAKAERVRELIERGTVVPASTLITETS